MLIRKSSDIPSSEITPEGVYVNRREFMKRAAGALALAGAGGVVANAIAAGPLAAQDGDKLTPWEDVTTYNNFYEFGTDKSDPAQSATKFRTKPWSVVVDGMVGKPATYNLEDFVKPYKMEERVYRHRCVEAWSMVIPWMGFPIAELLKTVEPTSAAKFVQFTTLHDPQQMPGQRAPWLRWPYVEGLRLDEAMHPLAIFAVGLYGKPLLPQNGAPLRTVIPWKYGFKGCKSIVKITLTDSQPRTAWNVANADEYGFYANVNPEVDHPRWTQAKERRIGEFLRRPTLMFNGYPQVASLYRGMDLRRYY